jgi:hypothetical protein
LSSTRGENQVAFLRTALRDGATIRRAAFIFPRGSEIGSPFYQITLQQNEAMTFEEFAWTPELETFLLLEHPTPMNSIEDEVLRLANILLNNVKSAESAFGAGFAQAVFVEIISENPPPELIPLLARVPAEQPSRDSRYYIECRSFLTNAIKGLQNTLVLNLKYSDENQVKHLMTDALLIVLDERFHISIREKLFPRYANH